MASQVDAAAIARLSLHDPTNFDIQLSQTAHRIELVQQWSVAPGWRVCEVGCGQGDCTTVLAHAVGEEGSVTAIDPADLSYGSPYTLGQAQSHISQGPLGGRISWVQLPPELYLQTLSYIPDEKFYDAAVLAHCLWYFPSPSAVLSSFRELREHSHRLLLAEWSLVATRASAQPHVLAALAQAVLECHKTDSHSNVRTVLSPKRLKELALEAGWKLESETLIQPGDGMLDGQWEVGACQSNSFEEEIGKHVKGERERAAAHALRDACLGSLHAVHGGLKGVRSMDVWVARFV